MTKDSGAVDINVAKVERLCDRQVPADVRDQLLCEVETQGRSITIYQFRSDPVTSKWTLYRANRNGR